MYNTAVMTELSQLEVIAGIYLPGAGGYIEEPFRHNFELAMDSQAPLVTGMNNGIPAYLTNLVDPKLIRILTSPVKAAEIVGEARKGDWTMTTATFTTMEYTGTVAAYGDWSDSGSSGINPTFPQRQSFHVQTFATWGELQLERAGLARIAYAAEVGMSAGNILMRFLNDSYFFGIAGLQNYGLLNDPGLPAPVTPATKTAGGTAWVNATTGVVTATANEVYTDIQTMYSQLAIQTLGRVDRETELVLALSSTSATALTATNSFNVSVEDLLKKNFPKLRVVTAPQYDRPAGRMAQLIATNVEDQETALCAFTEKMRTHTIIPLSSAFQQKRSAGTWGCVIFRPVCIASMIGL